MNPLMRRFLFQTSLLTFAFFVLGYLFYFLLFPNWYIRFLPIALIFLFLVTNLVHYYLLRIAGKSMAKFTARFMGMSFIKMFIYLVFAISFAFFHRDQAKVFLINFLVIYFAFSIVEVCEIARVVKQKSN
ncbi:hypothetical protein [Gaoshiqia sediminis]|uniref:ATP synthase protein I n=1 Tax=Gaoshiqia sediminis TaxID=2986998 RepID=A0AA41Y939_9BACT|nr:hypothetical protein [Gaoshiqia sediminis]MCW0481643.1 hypothetical protein [Gaoshiqia sediminis]